MNYTFNIIDTLNIDHTTVIENATRSGAIIKWNGGDKKDELNLVGTSLDLKIIAKKYVDGYLYNLFTGDENRYRVEMRDANDVLIFTWHILPDQYSEPFTNTPVISLTATDGIGRLKGKYLPDEYYEGGISVIDLICACLRETGVEMDVRFAPAIDNAEQKDWDNIFLPGERFKDKDKKEDAYSILEELTTLNVVYQSENYWNIEGVNIREQRVYTVKRYTIQGVFIDEVQITRNYKEINGIATPEITMQPPLGLLTVSHENPILEINDEATDVENDGWTYVTEGLSTPTSSTTSLSDSLVYVNSWASYNGFAAYSGNDKKVIFSYPSLAYPVPGQQITLRQNIYVEQGKKYRMKVAFGIIPLRDDQEINRSHVENGDWSNPFPFSIGYRTATGLTPIVQNFAASDRTPSYYIPINFGLDNMSNEFEFYFIPEENGQILFRIFPLEWDSGIEFGVIEELELELIGQEEEVLVSHQVKEGWTTKKEVELSIYDNVNLYDDAFRLEKMYIPENERLISNLDVPVRREFEYKGKNHVSLPLWGAKLAAENIGRIKRPTSVDPSVFIDVVVLDVIYNFNNSDEHIIITKEPVYTGSIQVTDKFYELVTDQRGSWVQWTDTIYQVERNSYAQTVWNILSRLLGEEVPTIKNFNIKNNIKFNDFLRFDWKNTNDWVITNCQWDVDGGFTNVSIAERYYASKGSYSPIVEAGPDVYVESETAQLESNASDPDGFIVSYFWEQVTSTPATIGTPSGQNTNVYLPTDVYSAKFRVTVTDNDGNTGNDEVTVYKRNNVTLELEEIYSASTGNDFIEKHFKVAFDPNIPPETPINIRGRIRCYYQVANVTDLDLTATLEHEGFIQAQVFMHYGTSVNESTARAEFKNFSINYSRDNDTVFKLIINNKGIVGLGLAARVSVDIEQALYYEGYGDVEGTPIMKDIQILQEI